MPADRRAAVLTRELRDVWTAADASPLRVRRLAANLSQAQLADRAGLSTRTVIRAELESVSADTMARLATALGCARSEIDARARTPFS